jgi:Rrf2 family protein
MLYQRGPVSQDPDSGGTFLSQTAEYALRAVVHLARQTADSPVQATDLAAATLVPEDYLRKVLHELVRSGVLRSTRGKHGGFRLAMPAARLTLLEVVSPFDRLTGRRTCLLGRPECSDADPCPLHHRWKAMSDELARFFGQTTIADIAHDGSAPSSRVRSAERE